MSVLFRGFRARPGASPASSEEPACPARAQGLRALSLLVDRRPRALSRAQIRDVVWSGVFIAESTLTQAVNSIREALDDDARRPRFVRTARGFGYAFCAEARASPDAAAPRHVRRRSPVSSGAIECYR